MTVTTRITRRAAILGLAGVASAAFVGSAAGPLGRLGAGLTAAAPDPGIDVDYRLVAPSVEVAADTPTGTAVATRPPLDPAGEAGSGRTDTSPQSRWTRVGAADIATTVTPDADGRVRLITRASIPPIPIPASTPGEGGVLALAVRVGETPVVLDVQTSAVSTENGVTESEAAAGDVTPGTGELDEFVAVRLSWARRGDPTEHLLFEGTLAELVEANGTAGVAVDADGPDGAVAPGETYDFRLDWAYLADERAFVDRGLQIPGDVNTTQTDRVDLRIDVHARAVV